MGSKKNYNDAPLPDRQESVTMSIRLGTAPALDRRTDRQTDG